MLGMELAINFVWVKIRHFLGKYLSTLLNFWAQAEV